MTSLTDLLHLCGRGQVLLINLYDGQRHQHLDLSVLRPVWRETTAALSPPGSGDEALKRLQHLLHLKRHRHLRFQRVTNSAPPASTLYTATTATCLLFDTAKAVVNLNRFRARHGYVREAELTSAHSKKLADTISKGQCFNGKPIGHGYELCWATRDGASIYDGANQLRDRLGLVDIPIGEFIIQLTLEDPKGASLHASSPSAIEASTHRRFRAEPPNAKSPDVGHAVDLEKLRAALQLHGGYDEVITGSVPTKQVAGARFAGTIDEDGDICGKTHGDPDMAFANLLLRGRTWKTVLDELKRYLEKP